MVFKRVLPNYLKNSKILLFIKNAFLQFVWDPVLSFEQFKGGGQGLRNVNLETEKLHASQEHNLSNNKLNK